MSQARGAKTVSKHEIRYDYSLLTQDDLYLFNEGSHLHLHGKLGAHVVRDRGTTGTYFAVWAPDAEQVFVTGDFNGWGKEPHPLRPLGQSGIWHGLIEGVSKGALYKYHIVSRYNGYRVNKMDPSGVVSRSSPQDRFGRLGARLRVAGRRVDG